MTMALRVRAVSRLVSTLPPRSCHRSFYVVAQNLTVQSSLVTPTSFSSQWSCTGHERSFSSNNSNSEDNANKSSDEVLDHSQDDQPLLLYEGPFASLTLRLKRLSLTSAVIGLVGLPALSVFQGAGSIPATGQLAIIATAGATAIGSTALLGYCFSPYVHTLERLSEDENESYGDVATNTVNGNQNLVRIITRDILARRVETIFDPTTDVSPPPNGNSRPFCNFMVKGLPMYVHKEMVHDYKLRVQLVGEEPQQEDAEARNKKKLDDDEFL
mmetsp:Transcript_11410/g.21065  ORF Transcript_11410/g.21065 Transcript_11410/m.21065 type:complete len:271 (-) Transcript_11410:88-900(-)